MSRRFIIGFGNAAMPDGAPFKSAALRDDETHTMARHRAIGAPILSASKAPHMHLGARIVAA